jgi:hypothetical protein
MTTIKLNALAADGELDIQAFRTDDEYGNVVLAITAGADRIEIILGRTVADADNLAGALAGARDQASQVADDWYERPDEDDLYVTLDRGKYWLSWGAETRHAYPDRLVAIYEAARWMADRGEFPNAWITGEHGPAAASIDQEVRTWHDEGGSQLLPLTSVEYEPGDLVRYDGDLMEVVGDWGTLGIWLAVAGDHDAGEAFVRNPARVTPVYEPGQVIEYVRHHLGSIRDGEWVPGTFRDGPEPPANAVVTVYSLACALRGGDDDFQTRELGAVRRIPPAVLTAARGWVADNAWADLGDADDVADLTDLQVVAGIEQHYDGGWAAFRRDGE